jgi:hypothetical protein
MSVPETESVQAADRAAAAAAAVPGKADPLDDQLLRSSPNVAAVPWARCLQGQDGGCRDPGPWSSRPGTYRPAPRGESLASLKYGSRR